MTCDYRGYRLVPLWKETLITCTGHTWDPITSESHVIRDPHIYNLKQANTHTQRLTNAKRAHRSCCCCSPLNRLLCRWCSHSHQSFRVLCGSCWDAAWSTVLDVSSRPSSCLRRFSPAPPPSMRSLDSLLLLAVATALPSLSLTSRQSLHFSPAGACKFPCHHTLYICSFCTDADRCLRPHTLCTCSFVTDVHRDLVPRILYTSSFRDGARRHSWGCTPCTEPTCASACRCIHCARMRWCSQTLDPPPPQSLHCLLTRWCTHIPATPRSLHRLLWRWCSHRPAPPCSLQLLLGRWCWQMPLPPQSLHVYLNRWCSQKFAPQQSLHWPHWLLCRWCSQRLLPRLLPLPPDTLLFVSMLKMPTALSRTRPVLTAQSACAQLQPTPSDQVLSQTSWTLPLLGDLRARVKYRNLLKRLPEGELRPQRPAGLEERQANDWQEST